MHGTAEYVCASVYGRPLGSGFEHGAGTCPLVPIHIAMCSYNINKCILTTKKAVCVSTCLESPTGGSTMVFSIVTRTTFQISCKTDNITLQQCQSTAELTLIHSRVSNKTVKAVRCVTSMRQALHERFHELHPC